MYNLCKNIWNVFQHLLTDIQKNLASGQDNIEADCLKRNDESLHSVTGKILVTFRDTLPCTKEDRSYHHKWTVTAISHFIFK